MTFKIELSECCSAQIIYQDICNQCLEHCTTYEDEVSYE